MKDKWAISIDDDIISIITNYDKMSSSPRLNSKINNNDGHSSNGNSSNEQAGRQTPIKANTFPFKQQQLQPQLTPDPLEEIRKKIKTIIAESNEHISLISGLCSHVDMELEESYSKVQEEYSKSLDMIYNARMIKSDELNDKYAYEFFKVKDYYENKNDNSNRAKYNEIITEKNAQSILIENELKAKREQLKMEYEQKIAKIDLLSEEKRKNMNQEEYFEKMKKKISSILDGQPVIKVKKDGMVSNKGNDKANRIKK